MKLNEITAPIKTLQKNTMYVSSLPSPITWRVQTESVAENIVPMAVNTKFDSTTIQ